MSDAREEVWTDLWEFTRVLIPPGDWASCNGWTLGEALREAGIVVGGNRRSAKVRLAKGVSLVHAKRVAQILFASGIGLMGHEAE